MSGTITTFPDLAEQLRVMMEVLAQQNPRVAARFALAIQHPPKFGSVKLSWRDGKLNAMEFVEQTY